MSKCVCVKREKVTYHRANERVAGDERDGRARGGAGGGGIGDVHAFEVGSPDEDRLTDLRSRAFQRGRGFRRWGVS